MSSAPVISSRIINGPVLGLAGPGPVEHGATGASVVFEGIVRAEEGGRPIRGLMYEVYEPMASRTLHALCAEIGAKHGIIAISVVHSRGEIAVGLCSFQLLIGATHRREALAAMDEFIDRLKKDVPIWKTPVWA